MKLIPANRDQWLRALSLPFQAYIVAAIFFYFHWLDQLAGTVGQIYYIMRDEGRVFFSDGYFISFFALTIIAGIQALSGRRRGAYWNAAFAFFSLFIAFKLAPPNVH